MICRIIPANLVDYFDDVIKGTKKKKWVDLGEEIRYNNRINQEKEEEYAQQARTDRHTIR